MKIYYDIIDIDLRIHRSCIDAMYEYNHPTKLTHLQFHIRLQ